MCCFLQVLHVCRPWLNATHKRNLNLNRQGIIFMRGGIFGGLRPLIPSVRGLGDQLVFEVGMDITSSGGSRISPRRGRQLPGGRGGRQHTILPKFPKNCMKLKEFGPRGGGTRPKFYYVDPPLTSQTSDWVMTQWGLIRYQGRGVCPQGHQLINEFFSSKPLEIETIWKVPFLRIRQYWHSQ